MPDCVSSANPRKRRPALAGGRNRQLIIPAIILAAVVVADQLSKLLVLNRLADNETSQVIGSFFQLKLIFNKGGALGSNLGSGTFYLISSLVILIIVIYFILTSRNNRMIAYPMAAIAGGAIGNITDRIRLGEVIDFLDFDFFNINLLGFRVERWWTFNVADAAITVAVLILLLYVVIHARKMKSDDPDELVSNHLNHAGN